MATLPQLSLFSLDTPSFTDPHLCSLPTQAQSKPSDWARGHRHMAAGAEGWRRHVDPRDRSSLPPSFPGGPGRARSIQNSWQFLILSQQWGWTGWRLRLLGDALSLTFLASFPRDPGCGLQGVADFTSSSPCEGGDMPEKPASEFPGFSPLFLSLDGQRGNWLLLISPHLLQKCCNCPPGAIRLPGCLESSSPFCLQSFLLQSSAVL